jgi:hypothetical protein
MSNGRDYAAEYARYHGKPEKIKERAQRNQARAEMAKSYGKAAISGKDVHHKKAIRNGGGNGKSNLGLASVHKNRGWERER